MQGCTDVTMLETFLSPPRFFPYPLQAIPCSSIQPRPERRWIRGRGDDRPRVHDEAELQRLAAGLSASVYLLRFLAQS